MSWRDTVRKRDERRKSEDRGLPPEQRQGNNTSSNAGLWPYILGGVLLVGALVKHAWENDNPILLLVIVGMVAFGFGFAWMNGRAHKSKGRKERRGEREIDSIRWDESEG